MPIRFREARVNGLRELTAEVPAGAVVGLTGDDVAAMEAVMALAEARVAPDAGSVEVESATVLGPGFARAGLVERTRLIREMERARRQGGAILFASQEKDALLSLCDEVWWMDAGQLACRAAPAEAYAAYQRASLQRIAAWGLDQPQSLAPSLRRGDGRARLISIETLDPADRPAVVWRSGERAGVRIRVRFEADVDDPVVGIMIRTRVGFEVFGTNTELENVRLGRQPAGQELEVTYRFDCALCPQEYTLTAASHDADGTWHDWLEDAVTFTVADTRYTAGVANLRATLEVKRI